MIRALLQIVLNGVAILLIAKIVPGIEYQGDWLYLVLTGLVVGLLNLLVRPIVTLLSLPFIIVTLGLFFFAINGLMLYIAAALLDGLTVDGCMPALLGGIVMALFNWVIRAFATD
ncbi:MAG: phage holin family protein [Acidobacteriota bacterium]